MHRFFIELSYNGKNFHGWQKQPNAITIQETIENAISLLLKHNIELTGAGRTDTGVHAKYFVAHFDFENDVVINENLVFKLNNFLPKEIQIKSFKKVLPVANCRFDAISRTYKYFICIEKNPFHHDFAWYLNQVPDINIMNTAADVLFKYKDFTSFSKLHSDTKTNICKIMYAKWETENDLLVFTITADRFLRNMVRAIVGTIIDVGLKKISTDDFAKIIESKNRCNAGQSVPPQGLFLTSIEYPESIFSK